MLPRAFLSSLAKSLAWSVCAAAILGAGMARADNYDGTWAGTSVLSGGHSPKCQNTVGRLTMKVANGEARIDAKSGGDGHRRVYMGTVRGDQLTLTADDGRMYEGRFLGDTFTATRGTLQCVYTLTMARKRAW